MEWLYLIAAAFDGPFRAALGLVPLLPTAVMAFVLGWWLARCHRQLASRWLPWMPLLCVLALVLALVLDFLRPLRSLQDTIVQGGLGALSLQQAHAEIDRHYSIQGLMLRGLTHYGPLTVLIFGSLGLYAGTKWPRKATPGP